MKIELHKDRNIKNKTGNCTENGTEKIKDAAFILTVSDNGTGIPETVDIVDPILLICSS
jgi:two-component sensor histidine kinase